MADPSSLTCAVPTLNAASTLDWTLLSLHRQEGVDLKVVVVDSHSTDGTVSICSRWATPIRSAERGNMYVAVNEGLRDAKTAWVTYLNGDDCVYPSAYASLIALGEKVNADVVYGDFDFVDAEGRFLFSLKSAPPQDLLPLFRIPFQGLPQAGTVISNRLYQHLGGFSSDFRLAADADFFFRALRAGARFAYFPAPVCMFRLHNNQQTVTRAGQLREESLRVANAAGERNLAARLAFGRWRLRNLSNYVVRYLRAGLRKR